MSGEERGTPTPDWPPDINPDGLPASEQRDAGFLKMSFMNLVTYAHDFRTALSLFDYCASQLAAGVTGDVWHWQFIAAREGAMAIFHFGKSLENMMALIGTCPTLLPMVDREALRATRKMLRDLFPRFEAIRHAVAHSAELIGDPDSFDENAVSGPYKGKGFEITDTGKLALRNVLTGREFMNTVDGSIQSYEISQRTFDGLAAVRVQFYSAFARAARKTQAAAAAMRSAAEVAAKPDAGRR